MRKYVLLVCCLYLLCHSAGYSQAQQLWSKRYDRLTYGGDYPSAIRVDTAGDVVVAGYSDGLVTNNDYAVVKYSSNGTRLWSYFYNGTGNGSDYITAMTVDTAGNIYVTGSSYGGSAFGMDIVTVKISSGGTLLWARRYNGTGDGDMGKAIQIDSSSNVYVTGETINAAGNLDIVTIKYGSDGSNQWVRRYNGTGNQHDSPNAMALDGTGSLYVTGYSTGVSGLKEMILLKYGTDGAPNWARRYSRTVNGVANALAIDSTGNIYVVGSVQEGTLLSENIILLKINPTSTILWAQRFNGTGDSSDVACAVAVDADDNIYVAGSSVGATTEFDLITLKYQSNGAQLWAKRYSNPGSFTDMANAMALDASGNVIVVGKAWRNSHWDFVTLKYSPTGNSLWARLYNGTGNNWDEANAVTTDSTGNVYVTGRSLGTLNYDMVTIKYAP